MNARWTSLALIPLAGLAAPITLLRGLDSRERTRRAADIHAIEPTGRSLLPGGLLGDLTKVQLRHLFVSLRRSQPFTL